VGPDRGIGTSPRLDSPRRSDSMAVPTPAPFQLRPEHDGRHQGPDHVYGQRGSANGRYWSMGGVEAKHVDFANVPGAEAGIQQVACDHRPAFSQSLLSRFQHQVRDPKEIEKSGAEKRLLFQSRLGRWLLLSGDPRGRPRFFHRQLPRKAPPIGMSSNGLERVPIRVLYAHATDRWSDTCGLHFSPRGYR
jgi:hypothetical protein